MWSPKYTHEKPKFPMWHLCSLTPVVGMWGNEVSEVRMQIGAWTLAWPAVEDQVKSRYITSITRDNVWFYSFFGGSLGVWAWFSHFECILSFLQQFFLFLWVRVAFSHLVFSLFEKIFFAPIISHIPGDLFCLLLKYLLRFRFRVKSGDSWGVPE